MSDKEKIASIAKVYAEYLDPDNKPNREMIYADSLGFVEWLREKFEIVSKEKIRKMYEDCTKNLKHTPTASIRKASILESLFPQTLKSE